MTHIPYFVVALGCPSAGKSTVGTVLQERGFVHIDSDSIRNKLFDNPNFLEYRASPDFVQNEDLVQQELWNLKCKALSQGKNVYVDSCADREIWRDGLLNTGDIAANKYLIELQVDEQVLRDRNLARDRSNDVFSEWIKRWDPPKPTSGVTHITYQNNVPQDLDYLLQDLRSRF